MWDKVHVCWVGLKYAGIHLWILIALRFPQLPSNLKIYTFMTSPQSPHPSIPRGPWQACRRLLPVEARKQFDMGIRQHRERPEWKGIVTVFVLPKTCLSALDLGFCFAFFWHQSFAIKSWKGQGVIYVVNNNQHWWQLFKSRISSPYFKVISALHVVPSYRLLLAALTSLCRVVTTGEQHTARIALLKVTMMMTNLNSARVPQ